MVTGLPSTSAPPDPKEGGSKLSPFVKVLDKRTVARTNSGLVIIRFQLSDWKKKSLHVWGTGGAPHLLGRLAFPPPGPSYNDLETISSQTMRGIALWGHSVTKLLLKLVISLLHLTDGSAIWTDRKVLISKEGVAHDSFPTPELSSSNQIAAFTALTNQIGALTTLTSKGTACCPCF